MSQNPNPDTAQITRRPADMVMRLARLGSFHQSRLSFMRILLRRMANEAWRFDRPVFDIDADGTGCAVYRATGPERAYSLVAFAHDLPADQRSDRVIAEAWDATFTLFDGTPTPADIDRLRQNVPKQEAGRVSASELSLSRANRSVRLWTNIVDALAEGRQPDVDQIDAVGYLMRTTAVYGSGKFGAVDRAQICDRAEMAPPFQAEMLSVYLTRWFVRDLVNHMAQAKGGDSAVALDGALERRLGIGNSTGLGMAPFLINHPILLNNWIMVREEAIARVRSLPRAKAEDVALFRHLCVQCCDGMGNWTSEHPVQQAKLVDLAQDITKLTLHLSDTDLTTDHPWDRLIRWSQECLTLEGQELVASLILEPYGALVDGLASCMADSIGSSFAIKGAMPVGEVRDLIADTYGWALPIDWSAPQHCARLWYTSEEKLEPRLGERFDEPIGDYEQPLAPGRDAALAHQALTDWDDDTPIAAFLLQHPEHRSAVKRAQISVFAPYSEIRDNSICATMMPIDMLRAKLSFFGATRFDPRSDRWVRIAMYVGAPYPQDLTPDNADYWVYPEAEA